MWLRLAWEVTRIILGPGLQYIGLHLPFRSKPRDKFVFESRAGEEQVGVRIGAIFPQGQYFQTSSTSNRLGSPS